MMDLFLSQVNVTNKTSESAFLTWLPGPGNISHYLIKVNGSLTKLLAENLTHDLVNLTAGTGYLVQVIPVKCGRLLNPQMVAFYTKPNKVGNLSVTSVTETSVFLTWNKPVGNHGFYLIEVQGGQKITSDTESKEVNSLIPGSLYTFTVHSVVNDTWSEGYNISTYTKPGRVLQLRVSNNTQNSVLLRWSPPEGNFTSFFVNATYDNNSTEFNVGKQTEVNVTGLPIGTKITLRVTALTNGTLKGEEVTIVTYTAPGPVSGLNLVSTHNSLTANWTSSGGNAFIIELYLDGQEVDRNNITSLTTCFVGLKTAANYTVNVYAFSGNLNSKPVRSSCYTKPLPPTNARAIDCNKKQITIQWDAPENVSTTAMYSVTINSSFWDISWSNTTNYTRYTFVGLKSGTRYDFEVRTVAGTEYSITARGSNWTVAEIREIGLSMLCTSNEPLLCDTNTTRKLVFEKLHSHFNNLLGDRVIWNLTKQET
ncbi:hypothetical protein PFLUV_G00165710 [Perca fluviatilis]|uniref:Fibronectin type-III domain-containing protein n=1 Tax=Perca fluviatilis TaxID=8168 RepID=A0A6A5EWY7_PERFL|nr:hypothetical protein PFLUV_G00165710 [Perca fluviatilis]